MTIQNITVTTLNNTDLYFIKADGLDFIQCPITEATAIAVLRYSPIRTGIYQGEVYANLSALKQYKKSPVDITSFNVSTVHIFVSITNPNDDPNYIGWFQVGKDLPVVGTEFGLLESDVPVGTNIWVMVRDAMNPGVYDIAQSSVMSLVLTSPSAGTSFVYRSDITVEWEASANIPLVNIIIESATGIRTVSNIDASLGTYNVSLIADSGSFDFGQELVITVENSLQTIADSVTVEIRQATLQDFRIEESESEYRVAEDIHFTAYVNYGNLPSIWTVYAQYSSDGITYEDIQSATVGGSGLANITGCLIPAGASGTIYLRARVGDVYSDPIEALVVVPEIVISAVDVTVDVPFTISGTCNLAKNLRISYAKDPYSSWTVVDNSVTVQPNGTWSVIGVVISETGNFRLKAEYIQDTVSMFSDTDDVVVASGEYVIDDFESYADGADIAPPWQWLAGYGEAIIATSTDKYAGTQSGRIFSTSSQYLVYRRGFTKQNVNGKTLSFRIKFQNHDITKTYVYVSLLDGTTNKQSFTTKYVGSGWVLFSGVCDNVDADTIDLAMNNQWGGYIYIDDIKIV